MSKKFLLIGHSVLDTIITAKAKDIRPGGIFYSTIGLLKIKDDEDEINLVTNYDESSFQYFESVYKQVDLSFSSNVDFIPRVELTIHPDKERTEKYSNFNQSLILPNDYHYEDFDLILVNMITGFELSSQKLCEIKQNTDAIIYFDVHSLSRGINKNNIRFSKKIENKSEWLKSIDILQANEFEILTLSDETDELKIAEDILSNHVKILLITKGNRGSSAYYYTENKLESFSVPAIKIESENLVGCGDVFGAVFSYYYAKSSDIKYSLTLANKAGGIITSYNEIQDYKKLKKDLEKVYE